MGISDVISLLGGIALFLFGMSLMGDGLKKVAGNKLELVLYRLSSTPLKGVLLGTGVTAVCDGKPVRCGSFAAPLYGENAADASVFTLNLAAGRGALLHCFCAVPESWQTLELTYHPDFAAGRSVTFTVHRSTDKAVLGMVPASPAEVGSVVDL